MGWSNRSQTRVDYCDLLAGRVRCRVRDVNSNGPVHSRLYSCLLSTCSIFYLTTLVRRPRLILDFALTLLFNHLVFTTYYSSSLPTSLFFWAVMVASAVLMVIVLVASDGSTAGCVPMLLLLILFLVVLAWLIGHFFFHA